MALVRPQDATFAAVQNSGVWGTDPAIAVGANSKIEPLPPGVLINPGREYVEDETLTGDAGRLPFDIGNLLPDFDFEANARFEGAIVLLYGLFFGSETVTTIDNMAMSTIGAEHAFNISKNLDGIHGTFAVDWVNAILEVDFFKVSSIEFSWSTGERMNVTFNLIGRDWSSDPPNTAQVNDTAALGAVTLEGVRNGMLSENLTFLINDQDGAALAAGTDDLCVTSYTLTLDRQLDGPVTACSTPLREEVAGPAPGWVGTLDVEVPRWQDNSLLTAHKDGTVQKAQIAFTGPLIPMGDPGQDMTWTMDLPQLVPTGFDFTEQGTIGYSVSYELGRADSAPSGMNDVNPELRVENSRQTAYLT